MSEFLGYQLERPIQARLSDAPRREAGPAAGHRLVRRFLRHRPGLVALAALLALTLLAALAPALAPYDWKAQALADRFAGPSLRYLLGTDELGRDILSRLLHGARTSLVVGAAATLAGGGLGTLLGVFAGYHRRLDGPAMRLIDILQAFPSILLALAIVAARGPSLVTLIIAIAVTEVPAFVRLSRGGTLSLRERDYVTAARALGARDGAIIRRHILPNLLSPLIVYASLRLGTAILAAATLSFLGLGIQPPEPEWGAMVSTARQYLTLAPHTFLSPTLAILVTVLALNVLGDALRDVLDVRLGE